MSTRIPRAADLGKRLERMARPAVRVIRRAIGTEALRSDLAALRTQLDTAATGAATPSRRGIERRDRAQAEAASRVRFVSYYGDSVCNRRPFYNLGAGAWSHPFWRNVDFVHEYRQENRPEVVHDLLSGSPFPIKDGVAKLFYCSHVIEHVDDEHNRIAFENIHRCLEPGGAVRFVFPDMGKAYAAFLRNDKEFFVEDRRGGEASRANRARKPIGQLLIDFFAQRAQVGSPSKEIEKVPHEEFIAMIDEIGLEAACTQVSLRIPVAVQRRGPNAHMNWWTSGKLISFLNDAGFEDAYVSGYASSRFYPLRDMAYFDQTVPTISGYVEAVKS